MNFLLEVSFLVIFSTLSCFPVEGYPKTVKNCGISNVDRIVGGDAAIHGEYPWMVSIHFDYYGFSHLCGGSILNENWIITAAHCILSPDPKRYEIHAGIHRLSKKSGLTYVKYKVSKIISHEEYDDKTFHNDIALMRTSRPINFKTSGGFINGICLPYRTWDTTGTGTVIGWGHTKEKGKKSDVLKKVDVPLIPRNKCSHRITLNMICAGGEADKDSCQSDSGGPLMQMTARGVYMLIGIVSHGRGCGRLNTQGVYTKVAMYLRWLEKNMV